MRKIPTIFLRDPANMKHVTTTPNPACEWVFNGEGVATRKYDGTCVMLDREGKWWARREVKRGKKTPEYYISVETDSNTGKTMGWEPIDQSSFAKYHTEAANRWEDWPVGTYELIGPKINGNPEGVDRHKLVFHDGAQSLGPVDRTYEAICELMGALREANIEGVVFHHLDGRMAKIKTRDFPA